MQRWVLGSDPGSTARAVSSAEPLFQALYNEVSHGKKDTVPLRQKCFPGKAELSVCTHPHDLHWAPSWVLFLITCLANSCVILAGYL